MSNNIKWKIAQSLEIKWWQRYLKNKDVNEYLAWKKQYWNSLLEKIPNLPKLQQLQILDAGCGPAGIYTVLEHNTVDALDPLLDKYKILPHFLPNLYANTTFISSKIEDIDEQNKYDVIFCLNVINHVENIESAYQALVRALKPNGYLYISVDAHRFSLLKKIFQLLPGDALHPHQYNLAEYENFLQQQKVKIFPSVLIKREAIFDYYLCIAQK